MKTCRGCSRSLPLAEFYEHALMADGHLNYCKACVRERIQARYAAVREERKAYDAKRQKRPERRLQKAAANRRARLRDPARRAARVAVGNAIRDGRLVRQPCERCGGRAEAHHDDYSRPLDVRWLCFKCHRQDEHGHVVS